MPRTVIATSEKMTTEAEEPGRTRRRESSGDSPRVAPKARVAKPKGSAKTKAKAKAKAKQS